MVISTFLLFTYICLDDYNQVCMSVDFKEDKCDPKFFTINIIDKKRIPLTSKAAEIFSFKEESRKSSEKRKSTTASNKIKGIYLFNTL